MTGLSSPKRESRIRHWAKRLGSCLTKCQPQHEGKPSYLDTDDESITSPFDMLNTERVPRRVQSMRRTKSASDKTASARSRRPATSATYALPSPGRLQRADHQQYIHAEQTIRLVDASISSSAGGRHASYATNFSRRSTGYAPYGSERVSSAYDEMGLHRTKTRSKQDDEAPLPNPRSVLSWLDSFQAQQFVNGEPTRPPTSRRDSAADLTIRPLQIRPRQTDTVYGRTPSGQTSVSTQSRKTGSAQICYPPSIHSQVALNAMLCEGVKGWDQDWDKPLQHRIGDSKCLWKSASQRLLVRNKDSIPRLNEEAERDEQQDRILERMEADTRLGPRHIRSIDSIEELAEEDRQADEEWSGTWQAFDRVFATWDEGRQY